MEIPQHHQGFKGLRDILKLRINHIYSEENKASDWIANVDHLVGTSISIKTCLSAFTFDS